MKPWIIYGEPRCTACHELQVQLYDLGILFEVKLARYWIEGKDERGDPRPARELVEDGPIKRHQAMALQGDELPLVEIECRVERPQGIAGFAADENHYYSAEDARIEARKMKETRDGGA